MYMQEALNKIGNLNTKRYELTLPEHYLKNTDYPKAYLNHMLRWQNLNKIILHSTSSKISDAPELYGTLNLALSSIGGQTPKALKSKKSVASFKVMKGTLVGCSSRLRKKQLQLFCYKWTFLSPTEELIGQLDTSSIGTNVFLFELGLLDYKSFEPLPGLYVQFDHSSNQI